MMGVAVAAAPPQSQTLPHVRGRSMIRWGARALGILALGVLLLDEIGCPVGLHVDPLGRIYFTGSNHGIARIDGMEGGTLTRLGEEGSGVRQFKGPGGIATDRAGRVHVTDTENHRLVRMDDMTGTGWTAFGRQGSGEGELESPFGLAFDPQGRIYIADKGNRRIVRVNDITGAGWRAFQPLGVLQGVETYRPGMDVMITPAGLAVDARGRIYFTDATQGRIGRIDSMAGGGWIRAPERAPPRLLTPARAPT